MTDKEFQISEMLEEGYKVYEICEKMKTTPQVISRAIKKYGLKAHKTQLVSPKLHKALEHYKEGMTLQELANAAGDHPTLLYGNQDILKALGYKFESKKSKGYKTKSFDFVKEPEVVSMKPLMVIITDGRGEGLVGKVESITDTWNVVVDGVEYRKEGWQIREVEKHNNLIRKGKI